MTQSASNQSQIPDVLVHAGFHKTGTSSLQSFLTENREALNGHFQFFGKADFVGLGARARRYGQRPYPWRMRHFRRGLRKFLATLPDDRRIVLSRETFSGIMPGHRRLLGPVRSYRPAAANLAQVIAAELRFRYGAEVKIAFLYTLRDRPSWLRSVYGHILRSIRLRLDFAAFKHQISGPDLEQECASIRSRLGGIPVLETWLADHEHDPFGPAQKVLDIMGVDAITQAGLSPVGRKNPGHTDVILEEFLTLNRAIRNKTALRSAKEAILARERTSDD